MNRIAKMFRGWDFSPSYLAPHFECPVGHRIQMVEMSGLDAPTFDIPETIDRLMTHAFECTEQRTMGASSETF